MALCFVALFHVVCMYAGFTLGFYAYSLVFCAVVTSYNLMKYGVLLLSKKQLAYRLPIIAVTTICAVWLLLLSVQETMQAQLVLTCSAILCLLYMLPLYKKHGLRFFPVTKLAIVAFCWALLLVYYPAVSSYNTSFLPRFDTLLSALVLSLLPVQLFLFILALCIPFEIRDLKYDEAALHTLPQLVGVQTSKNIGIGLLVLIPAIEFMFQINGLMQHTEVYVILIITALAIWYSDRFKSDYFVGFFVEAVPILWLVLYYILE